MGGPGSRTEARGVIRAMLAAESACAESDFVQDRLLVTPAEERAGRRRYPRREKPLSVVTMGRGVVVSCYPAWTDALRAVLADRSRDEIFSAPVIAELASFVAQEGNELGGPAVSYACAPESFRPATAPPDITIDVVEGEE